jgi:hypothetical protein
VTIAPGRQNTPLDAEPSGATSEDRAGAACPIGQQLLQDREE